jgi:hypothetical protein
LRGDLRASSRGTNCPLRSRELAWGCSLLLHGAHWLKDDAPLL